MTEDYALQLSEQELTRYALMAEMARSSEAELWGLAGIVVGARVGDIGCGPGALFPALAAAVGTSGAVVGVDGDPGAVAQARAMATAGGWPHVEVSGGRRRRRGCPPAAWTW